MPTNDFGTGEGFYDPIGSVDTTEYKLLKDADE